MSVRRPSLTSGDTKSELNRKVLELVDAVNSLSAGVGLPNIGPGAGTYGGSGTIVESVQLDAKGRTLLVTTTNRGTRDGSIFSMVGPPGGPTPIVAYDFTRFDSTLGGATNITNTNMSGNSAYDLVAVGGAQMTYKSVSGSPTQQIPYAWTPFAARPDGGIGLSAAGTAYFETSTAASGLQLTGAMTAEWLGYVPTPPGAAEDLWIFWNTGTGETEANNLLYSLRWNGSATSTWQAVHEDGAGTDDTAAFFSAASFSALGTIQPAMITLTRASGGAYRLYVNGQLTANAVSATPNALPTGGTSSKLAIAPGATSGQVATLGFRLFGSELTAAQVRTSYQRTFFGVSS